VLCNSSVWGQADSIYTAMLLACLYFLMSGRAAFAMAAFGLAFSIKFQAFFLAPALAGLWSRRVIPLWSFLLVPAVYALAMLPAWLVGRPAIELATVYLTQSGTYHSLVKGAPNLYAWLPERYYEVAVIVGLAATVMISCFYIWSVWRSRVVMSREIILQLCLLSLIMTPFFLPKMHERFFYPADVVAIAYGFYFPKQYYVPVAIGFASFFSYLFFLLLRTILPLQLLSLVMLVALVAVAVSVRKSLNTAQAAAPSRSAIC
jgi:Gpi18-like mannosyltransferase